MPETVLNPSFFDKEALYKTIVEEQTELISIAYPDGLLTFVNEAYAQHFGFTPEAMVGTSLFDYVAVEARPAVRAHLQAVCECGGVSSSENQMLAADGTARWVVWTNRVITDEQGHVTYLQSIGRDLTARRQAELALKDSQSHLLRLYEATPAMLHTIDGTGHLLSVSDMWCAKLGYERSQVLGRKSVEFLTPASQVYARSTLPAFFSTGYCERLEYQMVCLDGHTIDVELSAILERDAAGEPLRSMAVIEDVTVRNATQRALAEQYELIRVTLQSIAEGVIATDARGLVQWFNPVAERMTGWRSTQVKGRPLAQVFHLLSGVQTRLREPGKDNTGSLAGSLVADCLARASVTALGDDTVLVRRDGTEYGIEESVAPILDAHGHVLGAVLVFRDVSVQRRLTLEMTRRAKHDGLTGLINRAEFESRIGQLLTQAQQTPTVHALLFIDLDRFKQVNDACGHAAGDVLLQQVAKMLQDAVRARDTVARLGGDEFAILLEHCVGDRAQQVGQQICDRMEKFRFVHHGQSFRLGTSIGLVQIDGHWSDTAAIVHAADTSCYAAKAAGRNRVHAWVSSSQAPKKRRGEGQWGARLEAALQHGSFVLYAQRVNFVQTANGAQGGASPDSFTCEVLLRMVDTDGSLILPGAFLPAAERLHLAARIDLWVVNQVLAWLRLNAAALPLVTLVSVNLTAQAVSDRAFLRELQALLQPLGTEARRLCLEIPEAVVVSHLAEATVLIFEMRSLGVHIALDDFGGASTSLSHLKNLYVDCLKIDGQYLNDLSQDALNQVAVRSFCEVARVLGAKTIAKSVESKVALATAYAMGIDGVQGFGVHHLEPLSAALG